MHICWVTEGFPSKFEIRRNKNSFQRGISGHYTTQKLKGKGIKVSVITRKIKIEPEFAVQDGVNIYWVKTGKAFLYPIFYILRILKTIKNINKRNKIDILHAQWAGFAGLAAVIYSKIYKIPCIVTVLGNDITYSKQDNYGAYLNPILRLMVKYILRNADYLISLSKYLNQLIKEIWKINRRPYVLPLSVADIYLKNVKDFKFPQLKEIKILSVCRIVKRKRIQDIIEALSLLKKDNINFKYYVVGLKADYYSNLIKLIKKYNLERNVIFTGAVKNEEVVKYYDKSDIFILVSVAEGLGNVFFEALARKKPIIISSATGASTILKNKENAVIVPPLKPKEVYSAIKLLIKNPKLAKKIGENGHKLIKENYTYDKRTEKLIKIYKKVIKR